MGIASDRTTRTDSLTRRIRPELVIERHRLASHARDLELLAVEPALRFVEQALDLARLTCDTGERQPRALPHLVVVDLGFPAATAKAVPLLARTASLLAHLAEEQEEPIGFLMASKAEESIAYEAPEEDGR